MALRKLFTCRNVSMCEQETFRKAMPHYLFKIQGFSQLSKNSIENYESNEFEAEGHKWKLLLYPNGNKAENGGDGHISLYLVLVDTGSSLPASGELDVIFRLFLFDQNRERYLIRGDMEGRTRRFREMKKVCGVPQFISLAKFRDPSNGYLVNDTCLFGAEVFVTKPTRNIECLSMATPETTVTHRWRISNFSKKIHPYLQSEKFIAGNHNWTLRLDPVYPGYLKLKLKLKLADCKQNPGLKVNADIKLRLRDQISGKHIEYSKDKHWFNGSSPSWDSKQLIHVNQLGKTLLVKDSLIVEAEIKILEVEEWHRKMSLSNFFTCGNISMAKEETFREAAPAHYLFKIQAFSQHSKNSIEKYESNEFEVGGHKWKLSLYPNGNKAEYGGSGYISLYLVLVDTGSSLPASGELNVIFRLFLFDQIRDRYLIRGDMEGRTRRFNEMKVCGVPQFVSLAKFKDPSNGYLVDDTCLFGAEVFITKPAGNIECLSMVPQEAIVTYTWRIANFSEKKEEYLFSEKFIAGNHNWNILIYPKGDGMGKNNSLSLFLNLEDCKENPGLKVYTHCKLRLRDQMSAKCTECSANHLFNASSPCWGIPNLIGLGQLNDKEKGFLVNDTCIVEAEVKVLGVVTINP